MIVAIPKEIKTREYRVALTPAGARSLAEDGHTVLVQRSAGEGSGFSDAQYEAAGARLIESAAELYAEGELIVKVKEPQPEEFTGMRQGQMLFTYLHLAAYPEVARGLLEREVTGIAYETIQLEDGSLPLLHPMSEIAGRMAVQAGSHFLQRENGGRGVLLGGATGVQPARVVILGGGTVGSNAARIAVGMGAEVTLLDLSPERLESLDLLFGSRVRILFSSSQTIEEEVIHADLLIGAVLVPGARAPSLVGRDLVKRMQPGSVIVDVAVDQGGCIETTRPTTHDDPVYTVDGVLHYGVANMPGAVSRTSTLALTNRTLPYLRLLANGGLQAAATNLPLRRGINTWRSQVCNASVAEALGMPYQEFRPEKT